ncbi:MAG TPA: zinc ribbon domain-containing protein [Acidimicrobiales bacterium]
MPLYEYRCRTCDTRFDARRPAAEADAPATCPDGHADTVRLLAAFSATGRAAAGPGAGDAPMAPCGANCACAH